MKSISLRVFSVLFVLPNVFASAQQSLSESELARLAQLVPDTADREIDFITDVQPILREHCYECHSGATEEGGLNLAIKARALAGGEHGAVLIPSEGLQSVLVHLVSGFDQDRMMPPEDNQPLTPDQIGILRGWVDQGAQWPESADVEDPRLQRGRAHWAFKRLQRVDPPVAGTVDRWAKTEVDAFIAEKLNANGISPSPAATARTLVRRLYFDLHGLPPTPDQVQEFCVAYQADPSVAIAAIVDRLLNSHHYGERWARHWLDVARYADSDGQESDRDRPHAYRYRDFVIDGLNDDMPYDQFVRWQIAGDEYAPDLDEAVAATGFLAAGPSMKLEETFLERERLFNRYNELDDIVSTLGTGLLGLTVGCARCHDHKYDAFSAREYYRLMSVFHSGDRISAKLPSGEEGFFFHDFDTDVRTTWLFRRSDFYDREIEVTLGFPSILSADRGAKEYWAGAKQSVDQPKSTLQRRALAEWITDVDRGGGPLLARVLVNRVWQHHFGQGQVRTSSDFGVRGDPPTHPELLEFLTSDFVANGWSIKRLHRTILNSATWQQSNHAIGQMMRHDRAAQIDPQNHLLWKMQPQRLESEVLRDAMLSVSGTLNRQTHGPGFKPYIPPEANLARNIQGGGYPTDAKDDATTRRRSIYMFHKRLVPYPMFQAFDRPDLMVSCARRQDTTVAPQGLVLLNDGFVRAVAVDFAERLIASNGDDDRQLVQESFELSFSRMPSEAESNRSAAFVSSQTNARSARGESDPRLQAVADFCQSLFGLNEFLYVD